VFGIVVDLSNSQSAPAVGLAPTFTTGNCRMALLLPDGKFGLLRIQDAERLMGMPVDWTSPAAALAGASSSREGAERRYEVAIRWQLIGNAVCVPVARWIGERLRDPYSGVKFLNGGDAAPFAQPVPATWPRAAWSLRGLGRHKAECGEAPCFRAFDPVGAVVRSVGPPPSHEAVSVWRERMRSAGWALDGPLKAAIDSLLGARALQPVSLSARHGAEELQKSVQIRSPAQRRQVWAKVMGVPWWPCLVADLQEDWVPQLALRSPQRAADSLLVVFFGDGSWQWARPEAVLDFAAGLAQHGAAVPRGTSRQLFLGALQEATDMHERRLTLEHQPGAAPTGPPAEAVLPGRRRCHACRTCKTANRPCLRSDAARLAAAGHVGAALTAQGSAAVGIRLEVYWPVDERSYSGAITAFDEYSCCHRVLYDDDEAEMVPLWKQVVSLPDPQAPIVRKLPSAPKPPSQLQTPVPARVAEPAAAPAPRARRAGAAIDYAAMADGSELRPTQRLHSSKRCDVCRSQKKGQCGTPYSPKACLMRTPGMSVERQPKRRKLNLGGGGGGQVPGYTAAE
jgi:hypothetical protein